MKTILALDPGTTTGWALAQIPHDINEPVAWRQGWLGPEEHHAKLWALLELVETDQDFTIVTEKFDYRNDSREGLVLDSREYIGVVKLFGQQRNHPVVLQPASVGKIRKGTTENTAFVKRRNLEALNLWSLGPKSAHHMVDATGHALFYMLGRGVPTIDAERRKQILSAGGWR